MKKKTAVLFILFISLIISGWFLSGYPLLKYLSFHKPLKSADFLVAEGWLDGSELDYVSKHFHEGNYQKLITTGLPLRQDFNLYQNGIYQLQTSLRSPNNQVSHLQVRLRGTLHYPDASAFKIYINNDYHAVDSVGLQARTFDYYIEEKDSIHSVSIEFINDALIDGKDRNLHLLSIIINGVPFTILDSLASYTTKSYGDSIILKLGKNQAVIAQNKLINKGVAKNDIIAFSGNKPGISRTLSTAKNTINALDSLYNKGNYSINIISTPSHTRRTHASYCKFHTSDSVGMMAVPPSYMKDHKLNRFMNMREVLGILFIKSYFKK